MKIPHRYDPSRVVYEDDAPTLRETAENAVRKGISLERADLGGRDLRGAMLAGADLREANLTGADLWYATLRHATLDPAPVIADIHRAVYAAASEPDALNMSEFHTCATTHCRAGWVVHLAGAAGYALEDRVGTAAAAALIYYASDPDLACVPDFYVTNAHALADMKRLAEGSD